MYCRKCGMRNQDSAKTCVKCGYAIGGFHPASTCHAVPNHIVWAILATIFCFLPFGIVAIVYAVQVDRNVVAGDFAGALRASSRAKTWCWAAFALGVCEYIALVFLLPLGVMMGV